MRDDHVVARPAGELGPLGDRVGVVPRHPEDPDRAALELQADGVRDVVELVGEDLGDLAEHVPGQVQHVDADVEQQPGLRVVREVSFGERAGGPVDGEQRRRAEVGGVHRLVRLPVGRCEPLDDVMHGCPVRRIVSRTARASAALSAGGFSVSTGRPASMTSMASRECSCGPTQTTTASRPARSIILR
nr:hypothetical protein [Jiangella alkaliphila]